MFKYIAPFLVFVLLACKDKEPDKLDPTVSKKVLLLQVDYSTYKFNSGKEFSYFIDNSLGNDLPVDLDTFLLDQTKRITLLYGSGKDTVFDGTQVTMGTGKRIYPNNMDNHIFYFEMDSHLERPDTTNFQVIYNDYNPVEIPYDSIWYNISNLQVVSDYRMRRPDSKIGLFLFRPSEGTQPATDWKWFVLIRD